MLREKPDTDPLARWGGRVGFARIFFLIQCLPGRPVCAPYMMRMREGFSSGGSGAGGAGGSSILGAGLAGTVLGSGDGAGAGSGEGFGLGGGGGSAASAGLGARGTTVSTLVGFGRLRSAGGGSFGGGDPGGGDVVGAGEVVSRGAATGALERNSEATQPRVRSRFTRTWTQSSASPSFSNSSLRSMKPILGKSIPGPALKFRRPTLT